MEQKEIDFFIDEVIQNTEFLTLPSVPMVEYKEDGIKYKVSDLSLLDRAGVRAIGDIINYAANHEDAEEVCLEIPSGMSQKECNIITSIVMGFSYYAEKRGRWMVHNGLVSGWTRLEYQGREFIVFDLTMSTAESIFRLAKKARAEMRYKLDVKEIIRQCANDLANSQHE